MRVQTSLHAELIMWLTTDIDPQWTLWFQEICKWNKTENKPTLTVTPIFHSSDCSVGVTTKVILHASTHYHFLSFTMSIATSDIISTYLLRVQILYQNQKLCFDPPNTACGTQMSL